MLKLKVFLTLWAIASCIGAVTIEVGAAQTVKPGNTFGKSKKLEKRTAKASSSIDKYVGQLQKTERTLGRMGDAGGDDLKKRYKSLVHEIERLDKAQARAVHDIGEMKSTAEEYFASWQRSNDQIAAAGLRYASAEQRSRVMRHHYEIAETLNNIGLDLQPFMSHLRDLETFLGADLSDRSVGRASETVQVSQENARNLERRIATAQGRIKSLQDSVER